jgi:hypothetical protein
LVISGGDGTIDLEVTEHPFDAVALAVEAVCTENFIRID